MYNYDDLLGTPFREHGRDKSGFDCLGLHLYLMRETGISIACDSLFGSAATMEGEVGQRLRRFYERIETPEPWCAVTMWTVHPRYTTHVGTVLENSRDFIHILRNGRVVIDRLDGVFRTKITGFYRIRRDGGGADE